MHREFLAEQARAPAVASWRRQRGGGGPSGFVFIDFDGDGLF
jgi:hypothetical protein